MNLLILEPGEIAPDGTARLSGRRLAHARQVLRTEAGDVLRVGVLGGGVGSAEVLAQGEGELVLAVRVGEPPPARPGLDLVLALPRPKQLKRILPAVASLGVDRVALVNAARVEKSYFDAHVLAPETVRALLVEGLEQARDTALTELTVHPLFRPFVEDELDAWAGPEAARVVAHPAGAAELGDCVAPGRRVVLAVGPEGGWVPFELDLLAQRGFVAASAGERPLRVEVAVPYLLGLLAAKKSPVPFSSP